MGHPGWSILAHCRYSISRVGSYGAITVTMNFAIENKIWQRVKTDQ